MATDPADCLVILHIASRRITATVAWKRGAEQGEQIVAHRAMECRWSELGEGARIQAVADALAMAGQSAGVEPWSVYVCMSDPSLRANFATGFADLGQPMEFTVEDRTLALARAAHQPIGTNRRVLHALPQRWTVRDETGEHEVEDPVGQRGSRIACHVQLVTAERSTYEHIEQILTRVGVQLEGMIAPPFALYRGMENSLPKRGSTVIVDHGARHTSIVVHRKGKLVHLETSVFGGDHLTEAIADELKLPLERAEAVKREVDLSASVAGADPQGQTYLWREVQESHRHLAPAALVCAGILRRFLRERYQHLRDLELFGQSGRVHLFGRAAALGGLPGLVKEVFGMEVVLGTRNADREPGVELAELITVGLVRAAAAERDRNLAERRAASGIRQVASAAGGLWSWLTAALR